MRHAITGTVMLAAAFGAGPVHGQTAQQRLAEVERQFDASLNAAEMASWMKTMAAEPNHVGSPHNKANAEMVLAQFREWGWDAHIETFEVLYPTPISETLELLGANPYKATLTEPPIAHD
jgi:N-acetylated-alpha-linked acidic dipeptidase